MNIYWHKINDRAIIPTKKPTDAGYDVYCVEEHDILLMPHEHRLFATGLQVAPDPGCWILAKDRGSTGSKGIHTLCGVIDEEYRGEIFICLENTNDYPVKFTRNVDKYYSALRDFYFDQYGNELCGEIAYYPLSKAIAQLIIVPRIETNSIEMADEAVWEIMKRTDRGEGKLGSSGK